jgi:hypothetical protein
VPTTWEWGKATGRCLSAIAALATLVACGELSHAESAAPPSTWPTATDTPAIAANLQAVPASTVVPDIGGVQLEVAQGKFLGIGIGSSLADAVHTFGVSPVVENADPPLALNMTAPMNSPCLPQSQRWVINANSLTMVFEGPSAGTAQLTSWLYTGGPAVGFTRLIVAGGLAIGGTRQQLLSRFSDAVDRGDVIDTGNADDLRFGMDGDSIAWFGRTDCGEPALPN